MSLIFLTGMPGAGKTFWAAKIAAHYHLGFIDLDIYIQQREQTTVQNIFEHQGEAAFRNKESAALKEIITNRAEHTIIACGGGTPCYNNNLYMMQRSGKIIYLQCTTAELVRRLALDITHRPLLQQKDNLEDYLIVLLSARKSFYAQADHIIDAENISLATFAEIIPQCINLH